MIGRSSDNRADVGRPLDVGPHAHHVGADGFCVVCQQHVGQLDEPNGHRPTRSSSARGVDVAAELVAIRRDLDQLRRMLAQLLPHHGSAGPAVVNDDDEIPLPDEPPDDDEPPPPEWDGAP